MLSNIFTMTDNTISLIALLPTAAYTFTALASWFQSGSRPKLIKRLGLLSAVAGIIIVCFSSFFVMEQGLLQSGLLGINGMGLSVRLDSVSMIMSGLIALLGFIILKFSNNYLDGDPRQGAFLGRLAATIASVQLLVLSGNLGILLISWILTSISLHRLLVFYSDRPRAQIAAKKKFILARMGDVTLFLAILLLYRQFGTGNLEEIFTVLKSQTTTDTSLSLEWAGLFLVITALLKSAQFPTHGWLIEVMETPTPVSAMLHAGLLNAGPFLIIRLSFIIEANAFAGIVLMVVGGLTALLASVIYLTQTSVKTALGYSSMAHMGFSLMVCGLGAFPPAMLHLIAHSFYKAHSFLSSGTVIDLIRGSRMEQRPRSVRPGKVMLGTAMALVLYIGFAMIWGIDPQSELSLLLLGAIIILGLSRIFTYALDFQGNFALLLQASLIALLVSVAFFGLESGASHLLAGQVPELTFPEMGKLITMALILVAFGVVVFLQILAPRLSYRPLYRRLAIHIRNGFYANAFFDRLVGAWQLSADVRE